MSVDRLPGLVLMTRCSILDASLASTFVFQAFLRHRFTGLSAKGFYRRGPWLKKMFKINADMRLQCFSRCIDCSQLHILGNRRRYSFLKPF